MQEQSGPSAFWSLVMWALRLGLIPFGLGCFFLIQQREWEMAGLAALGALLLFGLQRTAGRQAQGWIVDGHGERQRVESWNRGVAIFIPTTREQRMAAEAQLRNERRKRLVRFTFFGGAICGWAGYLWFSNPRFSDATNLLFIVLVIIGAPMMLIWLRDAGEELLYLSGWQDMAGAKVLDSRVVRPGLEEVMQQKAHGDGRIATEQEALTLLGGSQR